MASTTAPDPTARRVLVGRFSRYRDVKRAVDSLRVARIPERRITVLGRGLGWSPPLTAARAVRLGAWLGSAIGGASLLLLALAGAVAELSWFGATVVGAVLGAFLGVLLGVLLWRVSRDRSLLPESGYVEIDRYELLVERDDAPKARGLLDGRACRRGATGGLGSPSRREPHSSR